MPKTAIWPELKLQFDPAEIPGLANRYSYGEDAEALNAGRRIKDGSYKLSDLLSIVRWKSKRRAALVAENSATEIADALQLALSAKTKRSAIAVLIGLKGVAIPVASAIMTAIKPEEYTIIDFRALEALGVKRDRPVILTVSFYVHYFEVCRKLANASEVPLRTFDRALWQWSKENISGGY